MSTYKQVNEKFYEDMIEIVTAIRFDIVTNNYVDAKKKLDLFSELLKAVYGGTNK